MAKNIKVSTTEKFISSFSGSVPVGTVVETLGYTTEGDGGGAQWTKTATTGTASQSPAQLGNALLNDASGNEWALVVSDKLNVKSLGAILDGVADNTLIFRAALASPHKNIDISTGVMLVVPVDTTSDPLFISAIAGRVISGAGVITANSQIKRLLRCTGANSKVSINIDGNDNIGYAVMMQCVNPTVENCNIKNLNGFDNWGAVAIRIEHNGINSKFTVKNNVVENCYSVGDGIPSNGIGMCRAVIAESDLDVSQRSTIADNEFYDINGEEGDAIVIISFDGVSAFFNFPCDIKDNLINGFTRRGVKVQASQVDVITNTIQNNLTAASGQEQRAIDIIEGNNNTASFNTLIDCKFMGQIASFRGATNIGTNITISHNKVYGIGAETTTALFPVKYLDSSVVFGNSVYCPNYAGSTYFLKNLNGLNFNAVNNITNGVLIEQESVADLVYIGSLSDSDAMVVSVNRATNKSFKLHNQDATLNSGELIAAIEVQQNDNDSDIVTASLVARASGSTGGTDWEFNTGNPNGTPNEKAMTLTQSGLLSLDRISSTISLRNSADTAYVLSVDTSGRLLINGSIVGNQT